MLKAGSGGAALFLHSSLLVASDDLKQAASPKAAAFYLGEALWVAGVQTWEAGGVGWGSRPL